MQMIRHHLVFIEDHPRAHPDAPMEFLDDDTAPPLQLDLSVDDS
ncbi:MAG TPA: hypothetical protein VM557_06870 [Thermoanaerobaculia bacterium]|nr:hypothetical protein [Thermoanaerobaculia bacterium]